MYLMENLPPGMWSKTVPGVPRRTVRMIAAHIHLKPPPGTARAHVIATELLQQLLVAVNDAQAAPDVGL